MLGPYMAILVSEWFPIHGPGPLVPLSGHLVAADAGLSQDCSTQHACSTFPTFVDLVETRHCKTTILKDSFFA